MSNIEQAPVGAETPGVFERLETAFRNSRLGQMATVGVASLSVAGAAEAYAADPVGAVNSPVVNSGLVMPKTVYADMYSAGAEPFTIPGKLGPQQATWVVVDYPTTSEAFNDAYVRVGKGAVEKGVDGHWRRLGASFSWKVRGNMDKHVRIIDFLSPHAGPVGQWHPGDHWRVLETNVVKNAETKAVVVVKKRVIPLQIHHSRKP